VTLSLTARQQHTVHLCFRVGAEAQKHCDWRGSLWACCRHVVSGRGAVHLAERHLPLRRGQSL
jgi:mannose-6-phosphate isomerase-like protein (cupin superfamily)